MMILNVEKIDFFFMVYSRYMVYLLDGCGLGKVSLFLQIFNFIVCDIDEFIYVFFLDNESIEGSNEIRMNDLDRVFFRLGRVQVVGELNEV